MFRALQLAGLICLAAFLAQRAHVTIQAHAPAATITADSQHADGAFTAGTKSETPRTRAGLDGFTGNQWAIAPQQMQSRSARTMNERAAAATCAAHDTRRARSSAAHRYEPQAGSPPTCHALGFSARGIRLKN